MSNAAAGLVILASRMERERIGDPKTQPITESQNKPDTIPLYPRSLLDALRAGFTSVRMLVSVSMLKQ